MKKEDRKQIIRIIESKYKDYIDIQKNNELIKKYNIEKRLANLKKFIISFLRKDKISSNKKKLFPKLERILFGLIQDFRRLEIEPIDINYEKTILNDSITDYINNILENRQWYGQALLECYLEVYFNFTILKCKKKLEYRPEYLINPNTNQLLEYDIFYSDFDLAFEFQGEWHYIKEEQQIRDQIKIDISLERKKTLIHINAYQLNHLKLSELISNILITNHTKNSKKVIQRIFASNLIYSEVLLYLDKKAEDYINNTKYKYPITSNNNANCIYSKTENTLLKNYNCIPSLE